MKTSKLLKGSLLIEDLDKDRLYFSPALPNSGMICITTRNGEMVGVNKDQAAQIIKHLKDQFNL